MTGRLVDMAFTLGGKQRVTLEINGDFCEIWDKLHQEPVLDVEIKKHREKRSLSANAYFHVLCNKISAETGESEDAVKRRLVVSYGALARDKDGKPVGLKLPPTVDPSDFYPYVRLYETRQENGKDYSCYFVYKESHKTDSKEFAHLVDGAIEEAKELGAIALFGEKYGDRVRVIQFGSSIEFCGGTHVAATGNIGMMKIVSESSVAAGVRRIEAYTGARVEEMLDAFQDTMRDLKALFNNAPDLSGAIRKYIEENAGLKKQVEDFMKEKEAQLKEKLLQNIQEVNGTKVIKFCAAMIPADTVKNIAFQLRGEITENLFFVAGTVFEGKPMLTVMLSDNLVAGGLKAGNLVKEAAKLIQGGGGGQPHFATAGGKNPDGLSAAVDKVLELAGL